MIVKQTDPLEVRMVGGGGMVRPATLPTAPLAGLAKPVQLFREPVKIFAEAPLPKLSNAAPAPMEKTMASPQPVKELTQAEQVQNIVPQTTNNKPKAMQKLKDFLNANATRAFLIGTVIGGIVAAIIVKKVAKKGGSWK